MSNLETLLKKSLFWELSSSVNELCTEFFAEIGINYFDYARFYKNGKFLILFSDQEYFEFVLNAARGKGHNSYKPPTNYLSPGKHLWQGYIDNNFLHNADNNFNHYHGLTIIKHGAEYDEVMNFSAPMLNTDVINIYQNHDAILDVFAAIASDKFEKIINNSKYHLELPSSLMQPLPVNKSKEIEGFFNKARLHFKSRKNQVLLPIKNGVVTVSRSELICLELMLRGFSNKEIARNMGISDRTVEIYSANLLKKTNASSRLKLITQYSAAAIADLCKFT